MERRRCVKRRSWTISLRKNTWENIWSSALWNGHRFTPVRFCAKTCLKTLGYRSAKLYMKNSVRSWLLINMIIFNIQDLTPILRSPEHPVFGWPRQQGRNNRANPLAPWKRRRHKRIQPAPHLVRLTGHRVLISLRSSLMWATAQVCGTWDDWNGKILLSFSLLRQRPFHYDFTLFQK